MNALVNLKLESIRRALAEKADPSLTSMMETEYFIHGLIPSIEKFAASRAASRSKMDYDKGTVSGREDERVETALLDVLRKEVSAAVSKTLSSSAFRQFEFWMKDGETHAAHYAKKK